MNVAHVIKRSFTKAARQKRHSESSMTNAAQVDESSSMSAKPASCQLSLLKRKLQCSTSTRRWLNVVQVRERGSTAAKCCTGWRMQLDASSGSMSAKAAQVSESSFNV
jgi:hypothetical protein